MVSAPFSGKQRFLFSLQSKLYDLFPTGPQLLMALMVGTSDAADEYGA